MELVLKSFHKPVDAKVQNLTIRKDKTHIINKPKTLLDAYHEDNAEKIDFIDKDNDRHVFEDNTNKYLYNDDRNDTKAKTTNIGGSGFKNKINEKAMAGLGDVSDQEDFKSINDPKNCGKLFTQVQQFQNKIERQYVPVEDKVQDDKERHLTMNVYTKNKEKTSGGDNRNAYNLKKKVSFNWSNKKNEPVEIIQEEVVQHKKYQPDMSASEKKLDHERSTKKRPPISKANLANKKDKGCSVVTVDEWVEKRTPHNFNNKKDPRGLTSEKSEINYEQMWKRAKNQQSKEMFKQTILSPENKNEDTDNIFIEDVSFQDSKNDTKQNSADNSFAIPSQYLPKLESEVQEQKVRHNISNWEDEDVYIIYKDEWEEVITYKLEKGLIEPESKRKNNGSSRVTSELDRVLGLRIDQQAQSSNEL